MKYPARFCGHSGHRRQHGGEPDEAEVVFGFLVVASGHSSVVFDATEKTFDDVAMAIAALVVTPLPLAGRVRFDAGPTAGLLHAFADCLAIVRGVGQDVLRMKIADQRLGFRSVSRLAGRQMQMHRLSVRVDRSMNFRRQSAARSTEAAPPVRRFFFSPAFRREPADD